MQLDLLIDNLGEASRDLAASIKSGEYFSKSSSSNLPALGLSRAARLPITASLYKELGIPILLLVDRTDHALTIYEELALWLPDGLRILFPEPNPLFYEDEAWGETTRRDRIFALTTLARNYIPGAKDTTLKFDHAPIVIAPARALMTRTIPRREFLKATHILQPAQTIRPERLIYKWVSMGYERVNTVISPGRFARRGGILDIWPPADPEPTRIELFGDDIETLRRFDPATQRTIADNMKQPRRLLITPAREYLIKDTADINPDIGRISERHIPLLHTSTSSLLDYLPDETLVLIDDHQALQDLTTEVEEQSMQIRSELIADGSLPEDFPIPYLSWSEIIDALPNRHALELGRPDDPEQTANYSIAQKFTPGPRYGGRLKPLMDQLLEQVDREDEVIIVSRQASRLEEIWKEKKSLISERPNPPTFIQGSLSEGWIFTPERDFKLHLYTDSEIFGWRRPEIRRRQRPVVESPESPYADLHAGDYVVHIDHGIGIFVGLVNRTIDGIEREYLCIEYADEAQVFVPVHQVDRISRYVGPDNRTPRIGRLGGTEWRSVKHHVREAVQAVAEELLELYAKRSVITGHSFSQDTNWQHELEASFPYIETDDQVRVLSEVKQDMENSRPMDRLICGDVGYGKTEVALRAAFKAVMDGKQAAMLVPTTVLAQQHFQTFRQRLATFPVEVEMLSRFRSQSQQREIVSRLFKGAIDIVIGTHRLLSSDVQFKDLGLLIIDEEQRFGVTHKETLKKMRTEVDVLTLTATPIPRTLYMTLTGVRDISTINTPPEERLPIITHIGPYSQRIIRQAILRELERGGQVFFVHNRVQTITPMRNHLERLVPEARITIAHGQMQESELSERMKQFTNGEIDVLLSTSIIESGLDIPNANTLIVDRADTFGLAQLYQLRGRVGRGAQRAYAYFFRHKRRAPTFEGRQRLETIAENTQLGAGFSIAMRDLEIRGAGDLLGTRQHGHIAAVGFHLYTRLLAEAVRRLQPHPTTKKLPLAHQAALRMPVNVDLPWEASIPPDYVEDKGMRLLLYRRLADIQSNREIDLLNDEFNDRFGPPPEQVRNLLFQLKVRLLAENAGLASISNENGQLVLRYADELVPEIPPEISSSLRVGKTALWMPIKSIANWPMQLILVLEKLTNVDPFQSENK
jgi:transcription-repair coupling factor (superfamily II helicase)